MASLVDIDGMQQGLPGGLKWLLAGMGGAAGFAWAQQQGSTVAASCIAAGAAGGFCLVVLLFAGLRLLRGVLMLATGLAVLNYAVLIPFGYGDHAAAWLALGQSVYITATRTALHLIDQWSRGLH